MEIIKIAELLYKKINGPYSMGNLGRKIVIVVDHNGETHTISFSKFLVEMALGRKLGPNDTVHHIDSNIDNNDLDNLEVIDRSEHSKQDTRRVKPVKLHCAWCGKEFERSPRIIRDKAKKGNSIGFCGRSCAGKYSRMLQLKLIDKFDRQTPVDSEYFKLKQVKAFVLDDLNFYIDFYDLYKICT
jgi:hypothetical protein